MGVVVSLFREKRRKKRKEREKKKEYKEGSDDSKRGGRWALDLQGKKMGGE